MMGNNFSSFVNDFYFWKLIPETSTSMSEDGVSNSQNSNEIRKEVRSGKNHDAFSLLRKQRLEYPKNVIFVHLDIKWLRNKFFSMSELVKGKVDIFLINENKLDECFPSNQFAISGYKFIGRDRNKFVGETYFYITDQLPSRTIKVVNPSDIEILTIKITICKNKVFVTEIYKRPNLIETDFTTSLETIISKLSKRYEKLILMGDFNMTISNPVLSLFLDTFALPTLNIDTDLFQEFKRSKLYGIDISNLVLWKQTFSKLVSLTIIKWSDLFYKKTS